MTKHGTQSHYVNAKCRCPECRAAHAAYQRDYYHRTGYHRAESRALTRLRGTHREEFRRYMDEELAREPFGAVS